MTSTSLPLDDRLGIVLRSALAAGRWAAISTERYATIATPKSDGHGEDDVTLNLDIVAQTAVTGHILSKYPDLLVLAEEGKLGHGQEFPPGSYVLLVDCLDGSKLKAKGINTGVALQLAVVMTLEDGRYDVFAAYVMSLESGSCFGYDPYSRGVWYWPASGSPHIIEPADPNGMLTGAKWMYRDHTDKYAGTPLEQLLRIPANGGMAARTFSFPGSLTLAALFMWQGGARALVLPNREGAVTHAWDHAPLSGIMEELGYICVSFGPEGLIIRTDVERKINGFVRPAPVLWLPGRDLPELTAFLNRCAQPNNI